MVKQIKTWSDLRKSTRKTGVDTAGAKYFYCECQKFMALVLQK